MVNNNMNFAVMLVLGKKWKKKNPIKIKNSILF